MLGDKEATAALTAGALAGTEEASAALLAAETGKTTVQDRGFTGPSPGCTSTRSLGASQRDWSEDLANLLCSLAEGWEGCSI